jgi:hypothetical protein
MVAMVSAAAAACGRIIAPAPPESMPLLSFETRVAGAPVTIAARGARALYDFSFVTRRFGSDSTWGYRASDSTHARLRYTMPSRDSTRVLIEMWGGRCESGDRQCLRGDLGALVQRLAAEDAPPQ